SFANGVATLNEDPHVLTGLSQTFVVPDGVTSLQFTVSRADFQPNGPTAPDAFEEALLDAATLATLVGPAPGLSNTDAFFNLHQAGQAFSGPKVTLSRVATSGQTTSLDSPLVVTVDLHGIAAGTRATLFFDLLGFGPATSSITLLMGQGVPGGTDTGPGEG